MKSLEQLQDEQKSLIDQLFKAEANASEIRQKLKSVNADLQGFAGEETVNDFLKRRNKDVTAKTNLLPL